MCIMQGAVLCLAQAAQFLFSGGQDTTIKVWRFDAATQDFQPLVSFLRIASLHRQASGALQAEPIAPCHNL